MQEDLKLLLAEVQQRLGASAYQNEASVRGNIFVPLLKTLGWDIKDPNLVHHEFGFDGNKAADLMLCVPDSEAASKYARCCVIELKRHGIPVAAERQVFEYAVHAGAPLALISNGQKFSFYYPLSEGEHKERLVSHIDICERTLDDAAATFERYISFRNISSGQAKEHAANDLEVRKAKLRNLSDESGSAEATQEQKPNVAKNQKSKNYGPAQYSFLGHGSKAAGYKTIYFKVLHRLYDMDPSMLERLENVLIDNKKKKQFSRNRDEVVRADRAKEFVDGWWINTQFFRSTIMNILAVVCQDMNISLGEKSGLWIEGMEEFQPDDNEYDLSSLKDK